MENNHELLKAVGLTLHFKKGKRAVKAVDGISFCIRQGEVFSIVGESGCGKTTTGRMLVGLYKPTAGEIYFEGKRIGAGTR